jgi:hypothetical protein
METDRMTFSTLFYVRKDKANKKGEAPIYLHITINGHLSFQFHANKRTLRCLSSSIC